MNLFSSWPGLSPKSGLPDLGFLNLANSGKPEFACHPRLSAVFEAKAWMPGTRVYPWAGRRPDPRAGHDALRASLLLQQQRPFLLDRGVITFASLARSHGSSTSSFT